MLLCIWKHKVLKNWLPFYKNYTVKIQLLTLWGLPCFLVTLVVPAYLLTASSHCDREFSLRSRHVSCQVCYCYCQWAVAGNLHLYFEVRWSSQLNRLTKSHTGIGSRRKGKKWWQISVYLQTFLFARELIFSLLIALQTGSLVTLHNRGGREGGKELWLCGVHLKPRAREGERANKQAGLTRNRTAYDRLRDKQGLESES